MTATPRVLIIITPGFPANEQDSTCLPAQQLFVRKLAAMFPLITVLVFSLHYPYINSLYNWNGVTVIPFNGRNKKKADKLLLWRSVWKKMRAVHQQEQVIGILSFWCTECALIGHYFARRYQRKHYCWILGQDAKKENKFVRFIRPVATELIAMSPFLTDVFERNHGIRPVHMIPNGVDPQWQVKDEAVRAIDLLAAGSLIPLKQYELLIPLVASLIAHFPQLTVTLCGAGPEDFHLRKLIKKFNLEKIITMTGELPHATVLTLMQQSKIFVHPSSYEGFSTVCLEALQAGAQVVSFCDPVKEKVEQWHIVSDAVEMKDRIQQLLANPALAHNSIVPLTMDASVEAMGKLMKLGLS